MPWMVIYQLAHTWVYQADTNKFHGADWVIQNLAGRHRQGRELHGRLLGPDDNGKFHPKVIETLQEVGAWLKVNGEAIYAIAPAQTGDLWREGDSIRFTRTKDSHFYLCHQPDLARRESCSKNRPRKARFKGDTAGAIRIRSTGSGTPNSA